MLTISSIIPMEKRSNYRCYFCGETRSVNYITKINDPVIDSKPTNVCCCNKCILTGGKRMNENELEIYALLMEQGKEDDANELLANIQQAELESTSEQ